MVQTHLEKTMTVPRERTNAVVFTGNFLYDLIDPKKTPRVPKAIRQRAKGLLRHYPTLYEMEVIADREDGDNQHPFGSKVFGKGYM
jgi:hypothetical protein